MKCCRVPKSKVVGVTIQQSEFLQKLEGPEGCNFQKKEPGKPESSTWNCAGGRDKSKATALLKAMGDIDISGSWRYFERHGGFCDCQILFNVRYA